MGESNGTGAGFRLACVSTYPPRQCGIGTFSQDLLHAMDAALAERGLVLALTDRPEGYAYPGRVRFELRQEDEASYRTAADFLNAGGVDVLVLQHEYGIFGGRDGELVLSLLESVRVPVITTLHTVLSRPAPHLRSVTDAILRASDRVVVMAEEAVRILGGLYPLPEGSIRMIPHGVPDLLFGDPETHKARFGLAGRTVLLTFGLVSPGKGLEHAIRALPGIVGRHPDVVYVVLGATHPKVREREGEAYRQGLQRLAQELGVLDHVVFRDRFVTREELAEHLAAADLYVSPSLGEEQIVSGTLSYALAAGCAIVSTRSTYARELLDSGRGVVVPFHDADAIARAVTGLLDDPVARLALREAAWRHSRHMIWPEVGRAYVRLCADVLDRPLRVRPVEATVFARPALSRALPPVRLDHLRTLTDGTGVLQHARFAVPDRSHGYCTDDNARALIVALRVHRLGRRREDLSLANTCLGFLAHAIQPGGRRFRNFLSYERRWLEDVGSEDSHGRALQALGTAVMLAPHESFLASAVDLFRHALPAAATLEHPRAWAYSLLGLDAYLGEFGEDREARKLATSLADRLLARFRDAAAPDWEWCDDVVTYDGAKLAHALIAAGRRLGRDDAVEKGLRVLRWLLTVQTDSAGNVQPIGNRGWYVRGSRPARYDQQPIEAHALVEACVEACRVGGEADWAAEARRCLDWFLGRNDLREPLYDFRTAGCRDGLGPDGVNQNQGAESTLAWLLSLITLRDLRGGVEGPSARPDTASGLAAEAGAGSPGGAAASSPDTEALADPSPRRRPR